MKTRPTVFSAFMGILVAVSALWVVFTGQTFASDRIGSFTADQVQVDPSGTTKPMGKVYVTPDKVRMNTPGPDETGKGFIVIVRKDKGLQWILNPSKKLYMNNPMDEEEMTQFVNKTVSGKEEKVLGTETVNGFKCTKKEVVTRVEIMGYKTTSKSTVWVSDALEMPIRTRTDDGFTTELRNVRKGAPAQSVFDIPAGYSEASNMMEMVGAGFPPDSDQGDGDAGAGIPFKLPKGLKLPFGD